MTRFGLLTWGSEGDVQPFLALAAELAARHHEVTLALATDADASYEAPAGVTLRRVAHTMRHAEGAALVARAIALRNPLAQARLVHDEALAPLSTYLHEVARELASSSDVLVRHHMLHMAQAAALAAGTPEVSVFLTPDLLPTARHPPTGMPSLGPLQALGWAMMARVVGGVFLPSANALRQAHGQPRARRLLEEVWASPTANLIAVSEALWPRPDDWPARHHLTGSWDAPLASQAVIAPELEAFLDAGEAPVYVTFGSMMPIDDPGHAETLDLVTRAAQAAGQRLIVQTPRADEVLDLPGRHALSSCPHLPVFARCKLVVHHGGAGTTQTALRAGAPSVIVAHLADQFFWASLIEARGAGLRASARAKLTAPRLQAALERALGRGSLRERARALGDAISAERGTARAADLLERLAP